MQLHRNYVASRLKEIERDVQSAHQSCVDDGDADGAEIRIASRHAIAANLSAVHVKHRAVIEHMADLHRRDVDTGRNVECRPVVGRYPPVDLGEQGANRLDWNVTILIADQCLACGPRAVVVA